MGAALRVDDHDEDGLEAPVPVLDLPALDQTIAESLVQALGVSPVMADVLVSRGFRTVSDVDGFLSASVSVDRNQLGDLDLAAAKLSSALDAGIPIAIHGDYDCDGVCSTTALTLGLRAMGGTVIPRVPERADGYGLSIKAIDDLFQTGARVLVAVDCGITATAEVSHANALGMGVIVIDHHRPPADGVLPEAVIVHPALGNPDALPMCAAAVAVEVIHATARIRKFELPDLGLAELAGLATVTDVMPLRGANRTIVRRALGALPLTANLGLSALIDRSGIDRTQINARDLGWSLGPRINAAGRVRAAGAALELLLCQDPERAADLAGDLEAANAERRLLQQEVRIAAEIQAGERPKAAAWVVAGDGWHPGVVGIVAGGLAGSFYRPVVALSISGDTAVGSVRSVPGFNVALALEACSGLLERFGGHSAAAGLTMRTENIDAFRELFQKTVEDTLPLNLRRPRVVVDAVASPAELNLGLAEELSALEPFGEGNPDILIGVRSAVLERPVRMGEGKHARFAVRLGVSSAMGVAFGAREKLVANWGEPADVVGALEVNRWNGKVEPRFSVVRAVPAKAASIEVIASPEDWLERMNRRFTEESTGSHGVLPGQPRTEASAQRGGVPTLGRLTASRYSTLAVVADVPRRLPGLQGVVGGFTVCDWKTFRANPVIASHFECLVLLDPPTDSVGVDLALSSGPGWLYRAWTAAEVRFAMKVHDYDNDIDTQLRPFYRDVRAAAELSDVAERVAALQGVGRHPRSPLAVAWMLRVFRE
ncbi:MAG: DHH family phosphoesterase, partial [Actinomycetes bacterium]